MQKFSHHCKNRTLEIVEALHREKNPRIRQRLLVVQLATWETHTIDIIAREVGKSTSFVMRWLRTYRKEGIEGLLILNGGRKPKLSNELIEQIRDGLKRNRWIYGKEIVSWLQETHGVEVSKGTVYGLLRKFRREEGLATRRDEVKLFETPRVPSGISQRNLRRYRINLAHRRES